MLIKHLLIYSLVTVLISCTDNQEYEVLKIKNTDQKLSLPVSLIKEMSKEFKNSNPEIKLDEQQVFNKFSFFSKVIWPIDIKIWPKTIDNIGKHFQVFDPSVKIDLNSYLSSNRKVDKFYLSLEIKAEKLSTIFVYFIPSYKDKNGKCSTYFDITSYYNKKLSNKIVLSRKDEHYLKNHIGTYVFFSPLNKDLYQLNVLQLTDSSYNEKLCSYL